MTNEKKALEIAESCISKRTRNHPANQLEMIIIRDACLQMAQWKDELINKFKHHADEMYYAVKNLSTDSSQVRKAMEDYHNFLFKEYYDN